MSATTMASAPDAALGVTPTLLPQKSLFGRLSMFVILWTFKLFIRASSIVSYLKGSVKPEATYKKRYAVGAQLENLVYIPSTYKSGTTIPCYIDIHGGGFAMGVPEDDAGWCHYLAEKHGVCVISINYRKSPSYVFPQATHDLVEIVQAILDDRDLPIDKSKIALGGFSAGGNLTLSVAQQAELQGKLKGLICWYPITDLSGQYKGEYRPSPDGTPDMLEMVSDLFIWGYVPKNQDTRDPALSPIYADRKTLPSKIFFLTAEYDVLAHEAEKTAEFYAKAEGASIKRQDQQNWTAGGIRFRRVLGTQHAFDIMPKKDPEAEAKRVQITADAYATAAEWLMREIYV